MLGLWRMRVGEFSKSDTLILEETDLCYMVLHTSFGMMTSVYIRRTKDIPIVSI